MARRRRRWREQPRSDEPTAPRRRRVALGVVALTLVLVALTLLKPPIIFGEPPHYGNEVGDLAPGFTLRDVRGTAFTPLTDYRNWVILVDFMGARCGPCEDQMGALLAVHGEFSGRDFVIITVDVGELISPGEGARNATELQAFVDSYHAGGLNWRASMGNPSVREQYGVDGLPTLFLLDRSGRIRAIDGAAGSTQLSSQIRSLLVG